MDFSERLKLVRKKSGLKQADFAKALHVTSAYISRLELGKSRPSDLFVKTVCLIWGINERWLRTGEGRMEDLSDAIIKKLADTSTENNEELRRKQTKLILHDSQIQKLQHLFEPAFPRLHDMIALLSQENARGFVTALNLLIKEWGGRSDEERFRLQFKLEDLIPNFNVKKAALASVPAFEASPPLEPHVRQEAGRVNRVMVPVVGRAAAGAPIEMIENDLGSFDAGCDVRFGDFAVYAVGDSMIEAGIKDGDLCIIRPQETVESGEIALVAVGDSSTIKKFYRENGGFRLMPCNPAHTPLRYGKETPIRVLGKFIKVIPA